MELKIKNRKEFVKNFLDPIAAIPSDDGHIINIIKDKAYCAVLKRDNSLQLICEYKFEEEVGKLDIQMNDIARLSRVLSCIDADEIVLKVDGNCLKYDSDGIRFKFHFLDTNMDKTAHLKKVTKMLSLKGETNFNISAVDFANLIKNNAFITDSKKVYIFSGNDKVYAELTDKKAANKDSLTVMLSEGFDGSEIDTSAPVNIENVRTIAANKFDEVKVKCNIQSPTGKRLGAYFFEMASEYTKIKYAMFALVD